MDKKYLTLLAKEFPTIDSAVSEIVNLSAIRSLPKGTEYFFSDIHGEYEAFLHMLKSASGMIKNKIDITLGKSVSGAEREALAYLIYYPDKQLKNLRISGGLTDEWQQADYLQADTGLRGSVGEIHALPGGASVFPGTWCIFSTSC